MTAIRDAESVANAVSTATATTKVRRDRHRFRAVLVPSLTLVLFLIAWEAFVQFGVLSAFIVPPPSAVLVALGESVVEIATLGPMGAHFGTTLLEILAGFLLSVVIGVPLAVLMSQMTVVRQALQPYIVALNATPTIALAPLFIVWFGVGIEAKILLVVMSATFPVIVSTMAGLASVDSRLQRLMRSLGASRWETFRRLSAPSALPYFFAGLELAIVAASIGAVVGEFSGGNRGLGYITLLAQDSYNLPLVFSTLIVLAVLGIGLHHLVVLARRKIVFWI